MPLEPGTTLGPYQIGSEPRRLHPALNWFEELTRLVPTN